jgi:hypothetical protein
VTTKLKEGTNPLARIEDENGNFLRPSSDLIYQSIMRGGGEPFGRPFDLSIQSLTAKIVKVFKQHSFFGFEAMDRPRPRNRVNKFTRYGSSPFRGPLRRKRWV